MTENAVVSIVIPAFNPAFFAMTLQSALAQTQQGLEVLVCDDSEDEQIASIVRTFEGQGGATLRYVRNPVRLGFAGNVRRAVELASGELVKVLCDDDRLLPLCVERQARVLIENPEVSLVLAQRVFADANNYILPMRLANARFAPVDSLFMGDDILSMLEGRSLNFLGNLSSALMRRAVTLKLLDALGAHGAGFHALLDQVLFVCLMRHGHMAMLSDVLAIERLHPQRLSKQPEMLQAKRQEAAWMQQMLAQRTGEAAPASGWVRLVPLNKAQDKPVAWQEVNMVLQLGNWQTCMAGRVGTDCESYDELYQQWLGARRFSAAQLRQLPLTLAQWPSRPNIVAVVVDHEGDAKGLEQTLASLEAQIYPSRTCVVLSSGSSELPANVTGLVLQDDWVGQLNEVIGRLEATDWVYLLRPGDRLAESALLVMAERIAIVGGLTCIYSDEGAWHHGISTEPVFKPDFNIDLMRSYPYVGRALALSCGAAVELGGLDATFGELAVHDLLWRMVEANGPQVIEHIAEMQLQSVFAYSQWLSLPDVATQSGRVLSAHLQRLGSDHRLLPAGLPLINRVQYLHQEQPGVSIVVACNCDLSRVQQCVMSVIENTARQGYELLLVAPFDVEPDMAAWLQAMADIGSDTLRVVRQPLAGMAFEPLSVAAVQAKGEYLLNLAPTLQVVDPDWLDEMLQHAQRPEVGMVGSKVLDGNGKVVHAGMVLGVDSAAGPVCPGDDGQARGYLQRLQVVQNWSVLSADCLMIRKAIFDDVGGLDVQRFGVGLGALDLCLQVRAQGYLLVWTPYACLRQPERDSARELAGARPAQQDDFCERWLPVIARDPAYNANLNLLSANFNLDPGQHGDWNPLHARTLPSVLGVPINATAVGHYRVIQPFQELEAAGHVVGRIAHELPGVIPLARMAPDVVVLQLRHSDECALDLQRIARFSSARRVFEIDDYVLQAPSQNAHARNKPADIERQLRRSIGLCDRVVVTTEALADVLSDMHRDIRVVPNMLAAHLWQGLQGVRGTSAKPRVGWGGGTSHGGDLELIAPVVRALADEVDWVFFGMCPESLRPYVREFHPVVGLQAYPAKLASLNLDLALAPLEFHVFNDCKSNLRLLEYGACGFPVICSDTQAYRGNLPCTRVRSNSTEEWLQAIRMHLADPQASYRMGDELRAAVLSNFVLQGGNLQHWVRGWLAD
ncbi:glycosyltransferase [Pseudomonas faucium]|uniref:glycosyltransferase n=1 Tax=Pseudomonas faucium TaxID=2740518 RepID=UPI0039C08C33